MKSGFTVFKGGTLIDGNGGPPVENSILIMKGDRIEAVGTAADVPVPRDADMIDITGKVVMPGLIDAHCHPIGIRSLDPLVWMADPLELRAIRAVVDIWRVIDAGFTAIRDFGSCHGLHLKKAVTEGSIIGPRIFSCGKIITQTGGHGDDAHFLPVEWVIQRGAARIADGPDECRKAAREQLREGADFIKLCSTGGVMSEKDLPTSSQFTVEEIKAMVEEAHNVGAKAASHAQGTKGIKNALLAGVDTIEHGFYMDDEVIEMMIKQKAYFIPTLAITEAIIQGGTKAGVPEVSLNKAKNAHQAQLRSFEKAWRAGVKVGLGSDYLSDPWSPMGKNAAELEFYVKAGRTPLETIVCATKVNSEVLGMEDELGTLEAGKFADLIVVQGDPLKDISVLSHRENIVSVYKGGAEVPRLNLA